MKTQTRRFAAWLDRFNALSTERRVLTLEELRAACEEGCTPAETARRNDDLVQDYDAILAEEEAELHRCYTARLTRPSCSRYAS